MTLRTLVDGRVLLDSGSHWESTMGYSRAVAAGDAIHVAGCVGVESDGTYSPNLGRQTARCMERIADALQAFGLGLDRIVRVRIYTTRIDCWPEIAAVMGPIFAATRPANALVGIAALIDPAALVEVEVDAWTGPGTPPGTPPGTAPVTQPATPPGALGEGPLPPGRRALAGPVPAHPHGASEVAPTAIHRRVERLRAGLDPTHVARTASGWVVLGERQVLPGYCLLLPDPVVSTLNHLEPSDRRRYLEDMAGVGDALLRATGAVRINYEILGNLEPALHAHVVPRRADEPSELRTKPIWSYDWDAAPTFDPARDEPLRRAILDELRRLGIAADARGPRVNIV